MSQKSAKEEVVEAEVVEEKGSSHKSLQYEDRSNRGGLFWGLVLVVIGAILIAETVIDINLWQYFWPGVLIVLGLSLVLKSFQR